MAPIIWSGEGEDADFVEVFAVAIVLVSDLFLTSHAYLKDAAICVRACSRSSRIPSQSADGSNDLRAAKNAVQSALRQARLQPKDVQLVEAQHSSNSAVRQALSEFDDTASHERDASNGNLVGATGLANLCALGKLCITHL